MSSSCGWPWSGSESKRWRRSTRGSCAGHRALNPELAPRTTEAVLDKITMSAFEGTPLDIVLRDCGVNAFAIVGVATEVGIDPTVRHGADLGYIPVVVTDACGGGDEKAARRSVECLEYTGDALFTDTTTFCRVLRGQ